LLLKLLTEVSGKLVVSFVVVPVILCVRSRRKRRVRGREGCCFHLVIWKIARGL
jgi:hypothetical protein